MTMLSGHKSRPASIGFARIGLLFIGLPLLLATGARAQTPESASPKPVPSESAPTKPVPFNVVKGPFTLAATGDSIYLRPMLPTLERNAPALVALLRSADATFGNFETTAIDLGTTKGAPQAESGGLWLLADTRVPKDMKAMGFSVMSRANNHAADWGVEGMLENDQRLQDAGIAISGTGRTLAAARAPHYADLPAGRVALVAATATFSSLSCASDPFEQVPGRPGTNCLRTEKSRLVSAADFAVLARMAGTPKPGQTSVQLEGTNYQLAPDMTGSAATYQFKLNPADLALNLHSVKQGRENSSFAIMSLHTHERSGSNEQPTDLEIALAHGAIDAGADVFIAHGPHQLRGIEIYHGKPVFYSLGNFAAMNNSLDDVPHVTYDQRRVQPGVAVTTPELLQARNDEQFAGEVFYESVVAASRYVDGRLAEVRLYPIDLGVNLVGPARGVPHMADAEIGRRVLERLQRLSKPLGTEIKIDNNVGVIKPPP